MGHELVAPSMGASSTRDGRRHLTHEHDATRDLNQPRNMVYGHMSMMMHRESDRGMQTKAASPDPELVESNYTCETNV